MKNTIAIIGGGASGMFAAIVAAKNGASVTLYEGNDRLGKKLLATGNGKCNLTNHYQEPSCYHSETPDRVQSVFRQFSYEDTISFWNTLGLMTKDKKGYIYPYSEQAATVLDLLRYTLESLPIKIKTQSKVLDIKPTDKGNYRIQTSDGNTYADKVILCCGGKAAPKTGSDGSGYEIARKLGHKVLPVVPSLVQLKCDDKHCKALAGVRSDCRIHFFSEQNEFAFEEGEVQLTDYGISGIAVFQYSGTVNQLLQQKRKISVTIDFVPGMSSQEWSEYTDKRYQELHFATMEAMFTGLINKKIVACCMKMAGLKPEDPADPRKQSAFRKACDLMKAFPYHVIGSNSFEQAQVCRGGVTLEEVTDQLESIHHPGLYFAGELLDVDGICGGYNLQWAWSSGYVAGSNAAIS